MAKRIKGPVGKAAGQWLQVYKGIQEMRALEVAPVDIEGSEQCGDKSAEDKVWRFQTLVGLMLSSQTKDPVTYATMQRLIENNLTISRILRTPEQSLANEIYGVSFHNNKAKFIKKTAAILREKYEDDVPDTLQELVKLPGVGPKMALIALNVCYDKVEGIAVDTHVHRISNRLGWVSSKTPEQTRAQLEAFIPKEYWDTVNLNVVGFGQTICTPLRPKCHLCKVRELCPTGQKTSKSSNTKLSKKQSSK